MKLKILAKEYEVVMLNATQMRELIGDECVQGAEYYGLHEPSTSKIFIYKNLDIQEQRLTLLHEVIHAIYGQYGDIEFDENEEHINRLSTAIVQTLLDNPAFTQMFLER